MDFLERMSTWHDSDQAGYALGVSLGALPEDDFGAHKWVFWTRNPLGDALHETLLALVRGGLLVHDEEQDRFRRAGDPDVPYTLVPPPPATTWPDPPTEPSGA